MKALADLRRTAAPTLVVMEGPTTSPVGGRLQSVALLSGSFDPPTVGHLALAAAAGARADLVVLVYSVRTLPKEGDAAPPLLSEEERLEALRRICRARHGHATAICSHGLLADQVEAAAARFPRAELALVMGSDKAIQLLDPTWYGDRDATLDELFRRARVMYGERVGEEGRVQAVLAHPENERWRGRFERLPIPPEAAAVSSRDVRDRVRRGEDVGALVPSEVTGLVATFTRRVR